MSFLRELELKEVSRVRQLLGNESNVLINYDESRGSVPDQYNFIMNILRNSSEGSDTLLKNSCWPVFGIRKYFQLYLTNYSALLDYEACILKIRSESNVEPGQNKTVSEGFSTSCNEFNDSEFADLSVEASAQVSFDLIVQEVETAQCYPKNKKQKRKRTAVNIIPLYRRPQTISQPDLIVWLDNLCDKIKVIVSNQNNLQVSSFNGVYNSETLNYCWIIAALQSIKNIPTFYHLILKGFLRRIKSNSSFNLRILYIISALVDLGIETENNQIEFHPSLIETVKTIYSQQVHPTRYLYATTHINKQEDSAELFRNMITEFEYLSIIANDSRGFIDNMTTECDKCKHTTVSTETSQSSDVVFITLQVEKEYDVNISLQQLYYINSNSQQTIEDSKCEKCGYQTRTQSHYYTVNSKFLILQVPLHNYDNTKRFINYGVDDSLHLAVNNNTCNYILK